MPTRLPPTIRTGISMVSGKLLYEQLAVILVVFADEFVNFVQVRAKRERAGNGPGTDEYFRVLKRSFVLERIEIGPAEALDDVQLLAVLVATQLGSGIEADGVHDQRVAIPTPDRVAQPGGIGIDGMR